MKAIEYDGNVTLTFSVKSRAATSAWYQKTLGFKEQFDSDEMDWTEVALPTAGVTIGFIQASEPEPSRGCVPVFGVVDVEAARAKLEADGVSFDGETVEYPGFVKLATFRDPDGNGLMLAQDLTKHP